jgi:hypothetical protein
MDECRQKKKYKLRGKNYDWVCKRRRDKQNTELGRKHKPLRI